MAFPQRAATNTTTAENVSSVNFNLPTGIASGSLVVIVAAITRGGAITHPTPSGFTELAWDNYDIGGSFYAGAWVGYKFCTGSEGSTIASGTVGSGSDIAAYAVRFTGHHASTAPAISLGTDGSTNPPTLNPANWDVEDTLWGALGFGYDVATGAPTNFSNFSTVGVVGDALLSLAWREQAVASQDPGTFGGTPDINYAATLAIRPGVTVYERTAALSASAATASAATFFSIESRSAAIAATGEAAVGAWDIDVLYERSSASTASAAISVAGEVIPAGVNRSASLSATASVETAGELDDLAHESTAALAASAAAQVLSSEIDHAPATLERSASLSATAAVASDGLIAVPYSLAHRQTTSLAAEFSIETGVSGYATYGTASPPEEASAFADQTGVGTVAWSNPSYAQSEDQDAASVVLGDSYTYTTTETHTESTTTDYEAAKYPGSATSYPGGAGNLRQWYNAGNARVWDGAVANTGGALTYTGLSDYLFVGGFGFGVPSNASIKGIKVEFLRYASTFHTVSTSEARLINPSGGFLGSNQSLGDQWPDQAAGGWYTFGGPTTKWGATLTPSIVNNSSFGFALRVNIPLGSPVAYVDTVRMTVYYSITETTTTETVTEHIGTNEKTSHYLKATNFGFSVPPGSVVSGVSAAVLRRCDRDSGPMSGAPRDESVRLVVGGTIQGTDKASGASWSDAWETRVYGGGGDKWGLALTPSDVNASNFGFVVAADWLGTAYVDAIVLTVYYSLPGEEVVVTGQPPVRFSADERDAGKVLAATSFSTEMPGGFSAGQIQVAHPSTFIPNDYLFGSVRIFEFESDRTLYEGRVTGVAEAADQTVTFELEGWQAHLSDNKAAKEIFYDRDFGNWTGASVQRRITLIGDGFGPSDGSATPDKATGAASIELGADGAWTTPPRIESWYDAGGIELAYVDYAWKRSSGVGSGGTDWEWKVGLYDDDTGGSGNATSDLEAAGPGSGTLSATDATREWAMVYMKAPASTGTDGTHYAVWFTLLGVVGAHGITLQGSVSTPATGRGLYLSDVVGYVVGNWAPLLNVEATGIEATDFVIPHAVFREPTTARDMIEALILYGGQSDYPMDWWIEEGQTFRLASPENHGEVWRCRYDEGAEASSSGPDVQRLLNGVVVTYNDGASDHSVGPPGSGAEIEYAELADLSESNPSNRDGAQHWDIYNAGVTSQTGAVLIGQVILRERNRQEWRGEVTIRDWVRSSVATWEPAAIVRAGDYLIIEDDEDPRPRRIVGTSYNETERSVACSIGARPDRLDTLLARLGVVLIGRL